MKYNELIYPPGSGKKLEAFSTESSGQYKSKKDAEKDLVTGIEELSKLQDLLYAHDQFSVLIIFQAMDAAGRMDHKACDVRDQSSRLSYYQF